MYYFRRVTASVIAIGLILTFGVILIHPAEGKASIGIHEGGGDGIEGFKKPLQLSRLGNRPEKRKKAQPKPSENGITSSDVAPTTKPVAETPSTEESPVQVYRINVGDVIEVSVWRNRDLQKNVIVRPDGLISFPLVGDIPAAGLSLTELDRELTRKLSSYVRNPEVSVAVSKFGGTKVIVLGEVKGPGVYSPTGKGTALEVIALAGGFTPDAVKRSVVVVRGGLKNPVPIRLNLAMVLSKADIGQNLELKPNDIIYVPRKFVVNLNYWVKQMTPALSNLLIGTTIVRDIHEIKYRYPY